MYRNAIEETYADHCSLAGFCDTNQGRLQLAQRISHERTGQSPPSYLAGQFDKLVKETAPDVVIVTTVDAFHHAYIVRAMELGCDVITEKPMTTDAAKWKRPLSC